MTDQQEMLNSMCLLIEGVVNSKHHTMTQKEKEWYLNTSWQMVCKWVRTNMRENKV